VQSEEIKCQCNQDKYQSDQINELAAAMAKAQGEYSRITHNRDNPYFKSRFADLDAIMEAVRPALTKNGIFFTQQTRLCDGAIILHTQLIHSSGQWIESRSRIIPPKNDPQSYGSTKSYLKRYAATALLGITVSNDPIDDDGEVAMIPARENLIKGPSNKYNPKEESFDTITKEQLEELEYELMECPDLAEEIMDKMRIQSLADLPKSKYSISVRRIREIKSARNGLKLS
jgi:hypothetical protein